MSNRHPPLVAHTQHTLNPHRQAPIPNSRLTVHLLLQLRRQLRRPIPRPDVAYNTISPIQTLSRQHKTPTRLATRQNSIRRKAKPAQRILIHNLALSYQSQPLLSPFQPRTHTGILIGKVHTKTGGNIAVVALDSTGWGTTTSFSPSPRPAAERFESDLSRALPPVPDVAVVSARSSGTKPGRDEMEPRCLTDA